MDLSPEAKQAISAQYRKGDKVQYQEAMVIICIDMDTSVAQNEQRWTVRKEGDQRSKAPDVMSIRTGVSRAKSLNNYVGAQTMKTLNHNAEVLSRIAEVQKDGDQPSHKGSTGNLRKAIIDFPAYHTSKGEGYQSFVEGASPKRMVPLESINEKSGSAGFKHSSSFKNRELPQYLKTIFSDKQEGSEALIKAITSLYLKGVDSRQLSLLKMGFVKNDRDSKGTLSFGKFKQVFQTIMK